MAFYRKSLRSRLRVVNNDHLCNKSHRCLPESIFEIHALAAMERQHFLIYQYPRFQVHIHAFLGLSQILVRSKQTNIGYMKDIFSEQKDSLPWLLFHQ